MVQAACRAPGKTKKYPSPHFGRRPRPRRPKDLLRRGELLPLEIQQALDVLTDHLLAELAGPEWMDT